MTLTLADLNTFDQPEFVAALHGIYEHSPWIAERAWTTRPFRSRWHLQSALVSVVQSATPEEQRRLIGAHPELAGKAMVARSLTPESAGEQNLSGLTHCSAEEYARLQDLNAEYQQRFGWPFILAVRGPSGEGLSRREIIATFERRVRARPEAEHAECLRQIHRIAEMRLEDRLGLTSRQGRQILDYAEQLAAHSDDGPGQLTVFYLTPAHQACQQQLQRWMQEAGFDEVSIDAVGNVVGVYHGAQTQAPRLLTGSHFDTVPNAGRYDGRLGILTTLVVVQELHQLRQRLPFAIELVAFSEEEGQRFPATFLASSALTGRFDPQWLTQKDAQGIPMHAAMQEAGLTGHLASIQALQRDPAQYLGFLELHIEQGPVLHDQNVPLGVVTSINGSVRAHAAFVGEACHAGTTPMDRRHDALCGLAELVLHLEAEARASSGGVATVGRAEVAQGAMNVVPGRVEFTVDIRAPSDELRDQLVRSCHAAMASIATRRGLASEWTEVVRASSAPCHPTLRELIARAVQTVGVPLQMLPSGAGHDAMQLHHLLPQAMLFVRGMNGGISHNPAEQTTQIDAQCAYEVWAEALRELGQRAAPSC